MYTDEQSRINAVTSYFFLGPIFLLAKKGTPLGDIYVRAHAKKSSIITGAMFLALLVYFFLRPYIAWTIPGIGLDIRTIVLIAIVGITIASLMKGAYRAYHGVSPGETDPSELVRHMSGLTDISGVYSIEDEADKTRILASMIPFIGIFVSKRFNHPIMIRGRIIGSSVAFFYILSLVLSSTEGFLPFVILVLGILLFVMEGVYLMLYGRFVSWGILDKIPSYREIEAHILAFFGSMGEFFRVSFGREKGENYMDRYARILTTESPMIDIPPYFMPVALLGLPFWNIFGIPSLFIEKYKDYRGLVFQGLIITAFFIYFWFYLGVWTSPWLLFLLFPMFHIFAYSAHDPQTNSPGIGLILRLFSFVKEKGNKEKASSSETFTYSVTPENTPPSK